MNLNSHILVALALGLVLTHNLDLAILVGIGASLPDLDREYIFTRRAIFRKYQLHRALFHNVFFLAGMLLFNKFFALGILVHMSMDLLTSPTDRGIELFFPIDRIVRNFFLDYNGNVRGRSFRVSWLIQDPTVLVAKTSDPGLREVESSPWNRVYGPFKNSGLIDWTTSYGSLLFLIVYEQLNGGFFPFFLEFLRVAFLKYGAIDFGIILFYFMGELWRRKFHHRSDAPRVPFLVGIGLALSALTYQGATMYDPLKFQNEYLLGIAFISFVLGMVLAYLHVLKRHGVVVL